MFDLIITGVIALGAMALGAYIYCRGMKQGADIVWKATGDRPELFESKGSDYLKQATTEEMDNDILTDEENEPPMGG